MTVDKEKVKNILESDNFTRNMIIELVEERGLSVDKRYVDEMIEALLAVNWDEDQFEDLKSTFETVQKENSPFGFYVAKVEEFPDLTDQDTEIEVKEKLLVEEAKRDEEGLHERGFEIQSTSSDKIEGIYWTQTISYELDALRELKSTERTYDLGFEIDFNKDIIRINADNYGKTGELLRQLDSLGFETERVKHQSMLADEANEQMSVFVEDLKSSLQDVREQQVMDDFNDSDELPSLLDIDNVQIKLSGGELKTAKLEGHTGIFGNDEVTRWTEDMDGRIIHLRGEYVYKGTDFDFHVGLPDKLGRIRIKKKGRTEGNTAILEESFEFLNELFEEYFVDI